MGLFNLTRSSFCLDSEANVCCEPNDIEARLWNVIASVQCMGTLADGQCLVTIQLPLVLKQ